MEYVCLHELVYAHVCGLGVRESACVWKMCEHVNMCPHTQTHKHTQTRETSQDRPASVRWRWLFRSSAQSEARLSSSWKELASGVLLVWGTFFWSNNRICQQKDCLEGGLERGAWDFLIKLPSVIFGLPPSWDPKRHLHMIFTSRIFRVSLALIFIYLFICKKEFKSNGEAQKQKLWMQCKIN